MSTQAPVNRWRFHLFALVIFAAISISYMSPVLAHLTDAIPGKPIEHDVATMMWNIGWVRDALNTGGDLLYTDRVLIPTGADLRLHTYGLVQGVMAYPLTQTIGVTGGFNTLLTLTLFLNGTSFYLFFLIETQNRHAALIAAVWTMLGAPILHHLGLGRAALSSLWIIVGALLALRSLLNKPTLGASLLLALFLIVALFSELQLLLFTVLWLAWYGLYRLARDRRQIIRLGYVLALWASGGLFLMTFMIVFYPAYAVTDGFIRPRLEDMVLYSFRYWDYVTPPAMASVYGYELFVSAIAALLVLRRRYYVWLFGAVMFLVLAWGPYLQTPDGVTNIKLPFAYLSGWSPLANFRTPYRLTLPALIGLGMTAAYLLAWLLPRLQQRFNQHWRTLIVLLTIAAIAGRLLYAMIYDPLDIQFFPHYPIYDRIAAMPEDFTVIEVPVGVRTGIQRIGSGGEILQYYQQFHGKRLINGMVARVPVQVFGFYRSFPSLLFLAGETVDTSPAALHRDFATVLHWSGAEYILLHSELLDATQVDEIETFLDAQPELRREESDSPGIVIYRVWVE